ncbi:MAG TPA: four helix bundle protein, partial [Anaeromyxobacteraceae bacterium]|nr:four helix bundle protein [Anaeromyxobacteraceae bacterium]
AGSCRLRRHCACTGASPSHEVRDAFKASAPCQRVKGADAMNDTLLPVTSVVLPHHRLVAYGAAVELLLAVRKASVRDAKLRDEALRSAKSACLNCAEGAGRVTRGDKARAFAVARAEAVEAAAAVEIAALAGDASAGSASEVARLASRVVALLTPLVR